VRNHRGVKMYKLVGITRFFASILLIYLAFEETGPFTALALSLTCGAVEVIWWYLRRII